MTKAKKRSIKSNIYRITNIKDGKSYVGKTNLRKPINRWKKHILISKNKPLYQKNHSFLALHQAIVDDGIESFTFEILEQCIPSLGYKREQYWIRRLNTFGAGGYNATKGGAGPKGRKHSEETKRKLSEINQGKISGEKNPMFGKIRSEETIQKMLASRKKSRRGKNNPFYGRTHTDELKASAKEKSLAREFKKEWVEKRMKLSAQDVEEIKRLYSEGESVPSLAEKFSVSKPCIYKVLKFPRKIDQQKED